MTNMELAVLEFLKDNPNMYSGPHIVDAMRHRIESAVIRLVNRGIINVGLDWRLTVAKKDLRDE